MAASAAPKINIQATANSLSTKGEEFRIKPLVSTLHEDIRHFSPLLGEKMGNIPIPEKINILLLDENESVELSKSRHKNADGIGCCFFPEDQTIAINLQAKLDEDPLLVLSPDFDGPKSIFEESEKRLNYSVLRSIMHEMAHLFHLNYNPELFIRMMGWNKRKPLLPSRMLSQVIKCHKDLVLTEGIACWTVKSMGSEICNRFRSAQEVPWFADPGLKLKVKVLLGAESAHKLGHWFMNCIEEISKENPAKMVMDSPPKTIACLFEPKIYAKSRELRMLLARP